MRRLFWMMLMEWHMFCAKHYAIAANWPRAFHHLDRVRYAMLRAVGKPGSVRA